VFALGACGGSSKSSGPACPPTADTRAAVNGAITVCATEYSFGVKTITAPAGPLAVTLINKGNLPHTFSVLGQNFTISASSKGSTQSGSVTLAKGTYTFICTIPGHASAGMTGKLVIS
jgi:plastocyanin